LRLALGLEYDGSAFPGWQRQPDERGVQAAVEGALSRVAGVPIDTVAAGRTDAGVHATGQVIHFDTVVPRPPSAWVRGVNRYLPESVRVHWAMPVEEVFHARFSAQARTYRYLLLDQPTAPALLARRVGWFHQRLDQALMAAAAELLVGTHDFSSFRAAECQARSPERSLFRAEVLREGRLIVMTFGADGFLHHMVRNIVGMLVYVGAGRLDLSEVPALLASRDRRRAPPTFTAHGLYLTQVAYPARFALPAAPEVTPLALA
jgi:tRNA pseudouridine38-40 synthase